MRYEIGEYGLSREKDVCWASPTSPIHYLWYVEGSVEGDFNTYEDAMQAIKERMKADEGTGRMQEALEDDHIIIYFTAGWEGNSCQLWMHISGNYDKETLDIVHAYDDRIMVESLEQ
jgi:hypothetical protein